MLRSELNPFVLVNELCFPTESFQGFIICIFTDIFRVNPVL